MNLLASVEDNWRCTGEILSTPVLDRPEWLDHVVEPLTSRCESGSELTSINLTIYAYVNRQ